MASQGNPTDPVNTGTTDPKQELAEMMAERDELARRNCRLEEEVKCLKREVNSLELHQEDEIKCANDEAARKDAEIEHYKKELAMFYKLRLQLDSWSGAVEENAEYRRKTHRQVEQLLLEAKALTEKFPSANETCSASWKAMGLEQKAEQCKKWFRGDELAELNLRLAELECSAAAWRAHYFGLKCKSSGCITPEVDPLGETDVAKLQLALADARLSEASMRRQFLLKCYEKKSTNEALRLVYGELDFEWEADTLLEKISSVEAAADSRCEQLVKEANQMDDEIERLKEELAEEKRNNEDGAACQWRQMYLDSEAVTAIFQDKTNELRINVLHLEARLRSATEGARPAPKSVAELEIELEVAKADQAFENVPRMTDTEREYASGWDFGPPAEED